MKKKATAVAAALLLAVPLAAANVNGFENFTLSRGDYSASVPTTIAGFSSRTRTEIGGTLSSFDSRKPRGGFIIIR